LKEIAPRTENQEEYLNTIEENIVTFGLGPAGTGKTYLAMYQALCHLWNKKDTGINRIVLTRPVVEAGEKLGFLPGVLEEKMDPYMRPLYDAMNDIVGIEAAKDKISKGTIEIAPVAYMRGRTFHNCFVILDEAQNCTYEQIKMVLTRLGDNVKLVISGDSSQSDLNGKSGLAKIVERLEETEDIGVTVFKSQDVARSKIVKDVLISLERYEEEENG
jgi:phosphate starvation-inducible PhoH-like protein